MKKFLLWLLVCGFVHNHSFAQAKTDMPAYQMFNNMLVKPKRGMEKKFEDGVKAHNAMFHSSGPNRATLSQITEGFKSDGWYVWSMGPMTFTDMDHAPGGDAKHDADWDKNVDVYVEEYGESHFWKLQDKLSYTPPNYNPSHIDVWIVDIKPGMRYEFAELMKMNKAVWDAKKYNFSSRVFYNELWNRSGQDAAVIFNFEKYAEYDEDIKFKEDYESVHGPGSYDSFWKRWHSCVEGVNEQMRKFIK